MRPATLLLLLCPLLTACDGTQPATPAQVVAILDAGHPPASPVRGESLFYSNSCANCHVFNGETRNAPRLARLYHAPVTFADGTTLDRDRAYLAESILQSEARIVPGYTQQMSIYRHLSAREVADLIAFIETFSPPREP